MINNLFTRSVSTLSRKQLTRFREFVWSPYFNKHREVRILVDYLGAIYPNFTEKKCQRTVILEFLYPSGNADHKKLAVVFSYAMRLLEQFFRMEALKESGSLSDNSLLAAYLRKEDLSYILKIKYKEIIGGVNSFSDKENQWSVPAASTIRALDETDKASIQLGDYNQQFLDKKQFMLDQYYMMEKLRDACELLQRSRLLGHPFSPTPLFDNALSWLNEHPARRKALPGTGLYLDLFNMLKTDNVEAYDKMLEDLDKGGESLVATDLKTAYNILQNFCIRQINEGNNSYLNKLFRIYISQLDKGLLIEKGYLSEWNYKNIVTTGLRLQEYQWVFNFIEQKKELLLPGVRENAFAYNLANYFYHVKDFEQVLELLLKVEYTDLRYNLDAKSLLLRTYYDMDEEEALLSLTDAFRQYLKRNKGLTDFQKTGYFHLLKYARSAYRLKRNKGYVTQTRWKTSLEKLKFKIDNSETIFNLRWLQEKVDELGV